MRFLHFLASLVPLALAGEVAVLQSAEFDDWIQDSDVSLVKFFAPWCGHCKKLAPEFTAAAAALTDVVDFAEVDCTEDESKDVCTKYGVSGYPTLILFRSDMSYENYDGPRDAKGMTRYMKKQTEHAFKVLSGAAEIEAFKTGHDHMAVIGTFTEEGDEYDAFVATAEAHRTEYDFGVVKDGSAVSVTVYKTFDEGEATFSGDVTEESLATFINSESFPLLGEIGPDNYEKYNNRGVPIFWFFLDPEEDDHAGVLAAAKGAAGEFKGELSFVHLDGVKWARHAKNFGIEGTPGLVIQDGKTYFMYTGEDLTQASITQFAKVFLAGDAEPFVKSQPVPESHDGNVITLVGSTFVETVNDPTKDVLVEFYAPWCGHCKQLAPKYQELGDIYKNIDSVVIAAIDATENDTPVDIEGFPTIHFYPAKAEIQENGIKEGFVYSGERNARAMMEFVGAHVSIPLPGQEDKTEHDEL